jgi:hypothetical protein
MKAIGRQSLSVSAWIFVVRPPREGTVRNLVREAC